MRELKFRARDEEFNRWVKPEDINIQGDGTVWIDRRASDYGDVIDTIDGTEKSAILEQFIGLSDKNGKQAFLGDILKIKIGQFYHYREIKEAINGAPYIELPVLDSTYDLPSVLWNIEKEEIAGNIHENKDLLNA